MSIFDPEFTLLWFVGGATLGVIVACIINVAIESKPTRGSWRAPKDFQF